MKKISYLFLSICFLLLSNAIAGDYELEPTNGSDQWLNGSEWAVQSKNNKKVKLLFQKSTLTLNVFKIVVENNDEKYVNIDPDKIFYISTKYDRKFILSKKPSVSASRSGPRGTSTKPSPSISNNEYIKRYTANYDTLGVGNSKKLVRNQQLLSGVGFMFDSDNLAINRTQKKTDYYRSSILMKNSIYKGETFEKLLVLPKHDFILEMTIHIPLGDEVFTFDFKKLKEEEEE